jgi:hypothetical protein
MNFLSRWLHRSEIEQEQMLVRLWTVNSLDSGDDPRLMELVAEARSDLKSNLKHLSTEEIQQIIAAVMVETAHSREVRRKLRGQIKHSRAAAAGRK